jgi:hypothetical protein
MIGNCTVILITDLFAMLHQDVLINTTFFGEAESANDTVHLLGIRGVLRGVHVGYEAPENL